MSHGRIDIPAKWRNEKMTVPQARERVLLVAAYDALRSYQYGNANTELAEEMADAIGLYFSEGRE